MPPRIFIPAYAKVNLWLRVGPAITDPPPEHPDWAGYHPVDSHLHAIDLADDLLCDAPAIPPALHRPRPLHGARSDQPDPCEVSYAWARGAIRPPGFAALNPCDWPPHADLCRHAHSALSALTGRTLPVRIRIRKRIPSGAGLGGGSSDAAATLMAINAVHGLGLSLDDLVGVAAGIGADVAFFLRDGFASPPAPAIASGIGERLTHAPDRRSDPLALVLPRFGCPTGAVYSAFDLLDPPAQSDDPEPNELLPAAITVRPELQPILDAARAAGITLRMTGSGSAMFALRQNPHDNIPQVLAKAFSRLPNPPNIINTALV